MRCLGCGNDGCSARFCKLCQAFSCDVCRPDCTYAHAHFAIALRQLVVIKREQKASLPEEVASSTDDDGAPEQIVVGAFDEDAA